MTISFAERDFINAWKSGISVESIGARFGSSVHRLLCRLEDRGRIRRIFGCGRAIEIVQPSSLPNTFVDALRVMTADDLRACRQIIDERLAA